MMTRLFALAALTLAFALTGCNDTNKVTELQNENADLRSQLEKAEKDRDAAMAERDAAGARAADAGKGSDTASKDFAGIEGVSATRVGNEVHVNIEGDVLFDSGKTSLRDAAKRSLDKMVSVLNDKYKGKFIRVAGFTDTDPIKKSGFKSNYHLGFDRAYAVREYMIGKGMDGKVMSLSSFGPDAPLKTKALSRRVEVIVVD